MAKQNVSGIETMTHEEKKEFAEKMLNGSQGDFLRAQERAIRSNRITTAVFAPILVVAGILMNINLAVFLPAALVGGGLIHVFGWLGSRIAINRILANAGKGKVTYKEYKQLVKSGELEKWLKGEIEQKTEPVINNQNEENTEQDGSVTLSAEEVAVLKKIMNKKGLTNIDEITKAETTTEETTKPKEPTDTGRNS